MTKIELITHVTSKFQKIFPKKLNSRAIKQGVNQLLEHMSETISQNRRIDLRGFGSFSLHHRYLRNAHDPRTGKKVTSRLKYTPYFKPGGAMRERVNNSRLKNISIIQEGRGAKGGRL